LEHLVLEEVKKSTTKGVKRHRLLFANVAIYLSREGAMDF